jgi:hypothetical protein
MGPWRPFPISHRTIPSTHQLGEPKDALVSWQWEVDNPTKEGGAQFDREYIARANANNK